MPTRIRRLLKRRMFSLPLAAFLAVVTSPAWAQVTAPSIYTNSIVVQGEAEGTEFDDWANSGIPVVDMDPEDNFGDLDIADIQVANDNDFIYIHASLHNASPISLSNLFLAFDNDQNKATGFDVLQIGELGSELGYQTDFPFAQYADVFNLNLSITGGPLTNGGALIFPFWTDAGAPQGVGMEWAIPRDAVIQYPPALGGPAPAFPNPSFDFVVYTDQGLADISQVISYTLADAPAGQAGDFDDDGDVDGNDFLIWQRGDSPSPLSPGDLSDWQAHYGAAPPPLVVANALPEPSSLLIASIGLTLSLLFHRRRS